MSDEKKDPPDSKPDACAHGAGASADDARAGAPPAGTNVAQSGPRLPDDDAPDSQSRPVPGIFERRSPPPEIRPAPVPVLVPPPAPEPTQFNQAAPTDGGTTDKPTTNKPPRGP